MNKTEFLMVNGQLNSLALLYNSKENALNSIAEKFPSSTYDGSRDQFLYRDKWFDYAKSGTVVDSTGKAFSATYMLVDPQYSKIWMFNSGDWDRYLRYIQWEKDRENESRPPEKTWFDKILSYIGF